MIRKYTLFALAGLCIVSLATGFAVSVEAQGMDKPAPAPQGKSGGAVKGEEAKPAPAKDAAPKDGEAKPAGDEPKDYEALMKRMGGASRTMKKAKGNKDGAAMKSAGETIQKMAAKMIEMDTDAERKAKDDYKKWAKELEDRSKEMVALAGAAKPDWDKIETKHTEVNKVCESCHKVYNKDE